MKELFWPAPEAAEALSRLAQSAGLGDPVNRGTESRTGFEEERSLELAAAGLGVELEPLCVNYGDVDVLLRKGAPVLVRTSAGFLAIAGHRAGRVRLLTRGREECRVWRPALAALLTSEAEAKVKPELDTWLGTVGVPARRRSRARAALLQLRLKHLPVAEAWLLRLDAQAPLGGEAQGLHAAGRLLAIAFAQLMEIGLSILAWWLFGREAIAGRIDRSSVTVFLLVLLSIVPFRLFNQWLLNRLALDVIARMKSRLLSGALALNPDSLKARGIGRLFSQVAESEALEQLSLNGAIASGLSLLQLFVAAALFALAGASALTALLLLWVALASVGAFALQRRRRQALSARLALTHDLVERMVGHRTRLAQQPAARWHEGEDEAVDGHLDLERRADRVEIAVVGLLPRCFLVGTLGMIGLRFVGASAPGFGLLAAQLGLAILAYRSLRQLTGGLEQLGAARLAFEQIEPLLKAAPERPPVVVSSVRSRQLSEEGAGTVLLQCREARFRYSNRRRDAVGATNLTIWSGDRLLLTGRSGGGKSTLGALLGGLRSPTSGLILLDGLDGPTLGRQGWRERVLVVPQFHDNHVLGETLAFNLLFGRGWPPTPNDLIVATDICRELGLGPMLDRMPAGLQQIVGETGWQLSHGERSRLYIARALLQGVDLLVFDESFGALDPETLRLCIDTVERRAKTVVLIAHP